MSPKTTQKDSRPKRFERSWHDWEIGHRGESVSLPSRSLSIPYKWPKTTWVPTLGPQNHEKLRFSSLKYGLYPLNMMVVGSHGSTWGHFTPIKWRYTGPNLQLVLFCAPLPRAKRCFYRSSWWPQPQPLRINNFPKLNKNVITVKSPCNIWICKDDVHTHDMKTWIPTGIWKVIIVFVAEHLCLYPFVKFGDQWSIETQSSGLSITVYPLYPIILIDSWRESLQRLAKKIPYSPKKWI